MQKRNKLSALALLLALTLLLCGCSTGKTPKADSRDYHDYTMPKDTVTLNITTDLGTSNGLALLAEAFSEVYPNVTINIESLGWENLADRVSNSRSESLDGFMVKFLGEIWQDKFYAVWKENCFNFADAADVVDLSTLNANAVDALTVEEGEVYGVPFCLYSSGIITNMDLLEKCGITRIPETIDDLLDDCKLIKEAGYQPFRCMSHSMTQVVMSMTNSSIVKSGKTEEFINTTLHSEDAAIAEYFRPAFELIETLYREGYLETECTVYSPEANSGEGGEVDIATYKEECYAFLNGDVAFFPAYSDIITSLQKRETRLDAYNANPFHYEMAVFPGETEPALVESCSSSLFICKDSKNLDWMKQFVRFALWRENSNEVGNVAYFSDNQFVMSPYDTAEVHTDVSKAYYGATLEVMVRVQPVPAEFRELLDYQGYGLYQSKMIPQLMSETTAATTAQALCDELNRVAKIWYVDGNFDYWPE